jgi:hypothetical protein
MYSSAHREKSANGNSRVYRLHWRRRARKGYFIRKEAFEARQFLDARSLVRDVRKLGEFPRGEIGGRAKAKR